MNRLASACFFGIVLVCAIVAGWSSHATSPSDTAPRTAAAEIKELQQQRIELLGKAVKILNSQYEAGTADFTALKAVEREWLEARLDAADSPAGRVAVLEESQKSAEELVKVVEGRFRNGQCSEADFDRAKSLLLEVRIKLLRERQAADADKK